METKEKSELRIVNTEELPKGIIIKIGDIIYKGEG